MGTAPTKAASDHWKETVLLTISPLSLKHLARQNSPWHGALVSQQAQSFVVCLALLGQSGMSAMLDVWACVSAAIAAPTGAKVTPTAISNASRKRCTDKATSAPTIRGIALTGQVTPGSERVNFTFSDCEPLKCVPSA